MLIFRLRLFRILALMRWLQSPAQWCLTCCAFLTSKKFVFSLPRASNLWNVASSSQVHSQSAELYSQPAWFGWSRILEPLERRTQVWAERLTHDFFLFCITSFLFFSSPVIFNYYFVKYWKFLFFKRLVRLIKRVQDYYESLKKSAFQTAVSFILLVSFHSYLTQTKLMSLILEAGRIVLSILFTGSSVASWVDLLRVPPRLWCAKARCGRLARRTSWGS